MFPLAFLFVMNAAEPLTYAGCSVIAKFICHFGPIVKFILLSLFFCDVVITLFFSTTLLGASLALGETLSSKWKQVQNAVF